MEYPHRRYLLFLISKKLQYFEIASDCVSHDLVPPNEADLKSLTRELGPLPSCWTTILVKGQKALRDWLLKREILDLWDQDTNVKDVFLLLQNVKMRREFETITLMHQDLEVCREELALNYPPHRIPPMEVLGLYCEYFWDTTSMTRQGLFEHLKVSQDQAVKEAAYGGELERAYAILGLKQRVDDIEFIDNFVRFANLQAVLSTRTGALLPGQQQIGTAALGRAAGDLLQMRQGLKQATEGSSLRQDAMLFRAGRHKALPIPSIDEVREGVIDAEFEDAAEEATALVHRFPTRGGPGGG